MGRIRDLRRAAGRAVDDHASLAAIREACAPLLTVGRVSDAVARGNKKVFDATKKRHSLFFNYLKNLFVGESWRNSQIGREIDKEKPGMGDVKLRKHIAHIKRTWCFDSAFEPTGWDG